MGKNKQKKNAQSNSSKWGERLEKGLEWGTKAAVFAGTVITTVAAAQQLKGKK